MDLSFLSSFLIVAVVGLLGAISPGPDFVIVTKNSLAYSRRSGLYTALGVALGTTVHLAYCLMGIGLVIAESPIVFNAIKYAGAGYLIFIGLKSFWTRNTPSKKLDIQEREKDLSRFQALKMGFVTNALNPKATLFFLSVFSQVIDLDTSFITQLIYAFEIMIIVLAWFSLLAVLLSHQKLKEKLTSVQGQFEKIMGGALVILGMKIALG